MVDDMIITDAELGLAAYIMFWKDRKGRRGRGVLSIGAYY